MPRFRMRWNHQTGESYEVGEREGPPPKRIQIMRSMDAYISPATGRHIRSRNDRSLDMRESGCVDARDAPPRERFEQIREQNYERQFTEDMNNAARELCNQ